ncbi:hypothetical protein T10_7019 [Trichinella papuae]|uniref:Uncharacterized protein n=1 Tax=Trichinella papuae TaxID=268474 RepID=A0A0V1M6F2_9BILA|nr:hypothetical protein T10_7019 [Trichinella papuae]
MIRWHDYIPFLLGHFKQAPITSFATNKPSSVFVHFHQMHQLQYNEIILFDIILIFIYQIFIKSPIFKLAVPEKNKLSNNNYHHKWWNHTFVITALLANFCQEMFRSLKKTSLYRIQEGENNSSSFGSFRNLWILLSINYKLDLFCGGKMTDFIDLEALNFFPEIT